MHNKKGNVSTIIGFIKNLGPLKVIEGAEPGFGALGGH